VHVTANRVISTGRRRRRHHSELFKAEAVGACQQEGVSIAAVARGINSSLLLRRWVAEASGSRTPIAIERTVPVMATESPDSYVSVPIPASPNRGPDLRRGIPQRSKREHRVAGIGGKRVRAAAQRAHEVIRVDAAWLAIAGYACWRGYRACARGERVR
jgi:hypothetical protein